MSLKKVRSLLEELVRNEKGEHDEKGLSEAKEALSLLDECIKEYDMEEKGEGDEGAENESPAEDAAEGPAGEEVEAKPKAELHVRVPVKLHEMPMHDLEAHVKGLKQGE